MATLVDTSLLVRQADPRSADQAIAARAVRRLIEQDEPLHIFPQNAVEFWAVATRPPGVNGLGMMAAEADAERRRLEAVFTLLPETAGIYGRWIRLVNDFQVSGKPTHDARIVAAMLEYGLTRVLTFNGPDFRRYAPLGIIVVEPAGV